MDGLVFYVVRMKRLKQACHGTPKTGFATGVSRKSV